MLPATPLVPNCILVGWDVLKAGHGLDGIHCPHPNHSKYCQGGLAGERTYGNNSEKKQARREEAGGEENCITEASNITGFLQQTLWNDSYGKNVKSFSEESE